MATPRTIQKSYPVAPGIQVGLKITMSGDDPRDLIRHLQSFSNHAYQDFTKDTLDDAFASETQFTVNTFYGSQTNLTDSTLDGSVIDRVEVINKRGLNTRRAKIIAEVGMGSASESSTRLVQNAFRAAINHLNRGIASFRHDAPAYRSGRLKPGTYQAAVTIFQNGRQVGAPIWPKFTARSNVAITVLVRYANPLEVLKRGSLLYGAALAAKWAGGPNVNVNFGYRSGNKIRGSRSARSGSFPYLEIGLRGSTVLDNIKSPSLQMKWRKRRRRRR